MALLLSTPAPRPDLAALLDTLDPSADLVQRHLWLIALLDWIRGVDASPKGACARLDGLLDALDARPQAADQLRAWWQALTSCVDGSTLLSEYGFASRNAFVSELVERLYRKVLPATPETADACELFALAMHSPLDAQWLGTLSDSTLRRLAERLTAPADHAHHGRSVTLWQDSLLEAITSCTSQIRAAGFSPEIRLRMSAPTRSTRPFHGLAASFDGLRDAWLRPQASAADIAHAAQQFRADLDACRHAAASVYTHLDAHGISMDLVFRLRQLRERVMRVRILLDCLLDDADHAHAARLLSRLASVGQEQRSVRALVLANSSLLAAKVAERSSETGEHYITRNRAEHRAMLVHAAGGGAVTAVTTALKFGVMVLGLSAFWYGFWSGVVYAASFVFIQLLQFTLATKQPAMTAPAMAAKLKDISDSQAMAGFVDQVTCLVRSQVAAVLGNVAVVFPVVVVISLCMRWASGSPLIGPDRANHVLQSLSLGGPSALFAAFTGVLLFASSIIAGWVENWFVLHRLDSALRYNPRITGVLGQARASRWALFMRHQISGFASNISLGFMLGLLPAILAFLGLALDVRHVTLSAGQLGAACATLGWEVLRNPAFWWAAAAIPVIGILNLGVSFYLAFRVALQAHNVSGMGRSRVYRAVALRVRQAPLNFVWPTKESP